MRRFLPFLTGNYSTAPGLTPLSRGSDGFTKVFDIDETYSKYIDNKVQCRAENLSKYHSTADWSQDTQESVTHYLTQQLLAEYPETFLKKDQRIHISSTGSSFSLDEIEVTKDGFVSVFDACCSHVPEDIAVVQLRGQQDKLVAIHLCSPNHWDPRTKVGKPFNEIHVPVPEIDRTVKNYSVMLRMVIDKGPFTRFAWGVSTDDRLNHHPEPPPGIGDQVWRGRRSDGEGTKFFIRVERQNLIGLADVDAFIFTIRTYFYPVNSLSGPERTALKQAVNTMSQASLQYKGMHALKDELFRALE